jgi:hypothetical protein
MSELAPDRFETARSVADAVLYEGYVLYPYRASSRKNQVRFQWGVLTPAAFSAAEGSERSSSRTECLLDPGDSPTLSVRLRCLQAQHRTVEAPGTRSEFIPVDYLEVDGTLHVDWDEAIDQIVDVPALALAADGLTDHQHPFRFEGGCETELLEAPDGSTAGRFTRTRQAIDGVISIAASRPDASQPYLKVSVQVANTTPWAGDSVRRDDAMGHSLVAVHIMLAVQDGTFVSLLDPPAAAEAAARSCRSDGAYPVLIGDEDVVLASPIILYDHPEVAPQSPGDLYDSLEIDEILALRVMTLTDDEKAEARGTDPRAAAIIDRCDDMSPETMSRLHGQMREVPTLRTPDDDEALAVPWWDPAVDAAVDPWTDTVWVGDTEVMKGTAVRLRPSQRSDAQDMFLHGMTATVAGVFSDVDGETHVAVTVDDDPATEELMWQGRYLFFHPDEVEPLVDHGRSR